MAALIALVGAAPAQAQSATGRQATAPSTTGSVFSDIEKRIIEEYYRVKARVTGTDPQTPSSSTAPKKAGGTMRGLPKEVGKADDDDSAGKGKKDRAKPATPPPGLAKKDELPPGLAKKDKLPPGLKRDPLPSDLATKLPAPKPGTERLLIGDDLVLIDKKTSVVLDFIKGAAAAPKS